MITAGPGVVSRESDSQVSGECGPVSRGSLSDSRKMPEPSGKRLCTACRSDGLQTGMRVLLLRRNDFPLLSSV